MGTTENNNDQAKCPDAPTGVGPSSAPAQDPSADAAIDEAIALLCATERHKAIGEKLKNLKAKGKIRITPKRKVPPRKPTEGRPAETIPDGWWIPPFPNNNPKYPINVPDDGNWIIILNEWEESLPDPIPPPPPAPSPPGPITPRPHKYGKWGLAIILMHEYRAHCTNEWVPWKAGDDGGFFDSGKAVKDAAKKHADEFEKDLDNIDDAKDEPGVTDEEKKKLDDLKKYTEAAKAEAERQANRQ